MITTSLYLWWQWAWYTVLYLVSYLFYCQCIIYALGAFSIIGWLTVRTGGSLTIWKVRTCKAMSSELGLASWLQVTVSFHCNVVLHWKSLFKPCMSLADIQENTVHSLKSLGLLRGTQVVKEAMPLVIWTKTSWPELYKEGEHASTVLSFFPSVGYENPLSHGNLQRWVQSSHWCHVDHSGNIQTCHHPDIQYLILTLYLWLPPV